MAGRNEMEMLRMASAVEAFAIAGAVELAQNIVDITTNGGAAAPAAPEDTGELRASPRVTVGSPSSEDSPQRARGAYEMVSRADVARAFQLGGFALGETIWIRYIAGHANIIEGGRRPDRNGRMIGSDQAPDGFLWMARDEAMARLDRWRYRG